MSTRASVSVIIPTYNRANVLGRVLRSIQAQTSTPDEVIVVGDGSSDHTASVLERWTKVLPLTYLRQENAGASAARNTGIQAAPSDIVAFIDSDDEFEPEAIKTLRRLFERNPDAIVPFRDARVMEASRTKTGSFLRSRLQKPGIHYDNSGVMSRLIDPAGLLLYGAFLGAFACRRYAIRAIGGYDETLPRANDRDLYLRLAMKPRRLVFTWHRLETKHYTEGSLCSKLNLRLHYEAQLKVLGKHYHAPRFQTPQGRRLFGGAAQLSARAAIIWAGRESPTQVVRTLAKLPSFARTADSYLTAAAALPISAARVARDALIGTTGQRNTKKAAVTQ